VATTEAGERQAHIELQDISKHFGATEALKSVSLTIATGSVHALVGENGAGKSTLGKIVSGVYSPDHGNVLVDGEPIRFRSPREALAHGIAAVAQELLAVPSLSVAENVLLGAEPHRATFIRRRALRQRFDELAASAGFDLPANRPVRRLRTAEQQQVEILRALARGARLIVMDEPSAALTGGESVALHQIIRTFAKAGNTVLLISHFLREVLELADTVTVLRDGELVRTAPASSETEESLIEAMIGRSLGSQFPEKRYPPADARPVFVARDVCASGVSNVSLEVRAGEIVGIAGLVGAGRTEFARAVFGAERITSGDVEVAGRRGATRSPRSALRAGLMMIPESRKEEGLLLLRPVVDNVSLPTLKRFSRLGFLHSPIERRDTKAVLTRVGVRTGQGARVSSLSGGNQQKVLFARSVLNGPAVLIADEPTRGVDVGAKRAIYDLIVSFAEEGLGVLLISSEIEEILGLAHRVLVMRGGRICAELVGQGLTESSVLSAAFGPSADRPAA
jgi:ribose transport system ATP-binding protein